MSSKEFGNFGLVHKISQINFRHINILRDLIIVEVNYERKNEIQNSSVPKFDVEAKNWENSTAWRKLGTVSPFVSAIYIINRLDRETDLRNPSLRIARSVVERRNRYRVSNFLRGREWRKTSRKCPFWIRVSINLRMIRQTFDRS